MIGKRYSVGYHPDYESILEYIGDVSPLSHDNFYFWCNGGHGSFGYITESWSVEINQIAVTGDIKINFTKVGERNQVLGRTLTSIIKDSKYYKMKKYLDSI